MQQGPTVAAARDPRPRLDTPLPARQDETRIFDRFLAVCRERPDAAALVHARGSYTYAELERASGALATRLLDQPVGRSADPAADDTVVALYARRSAELVVGMLACLRAGLAFAVLDAGYPVERLRQLLAVARAGRCVAAGATDDDEPVLAQLALPHAPLRVELAELLRGAPRGFDARVDAARADAIAYLLFTSGTTGVPRCIATPHAPLVHFIDWYAGQFAVDPSCRFSLLSGLGHDPVLRDIFVPLAAGAELHVPPQAVLLDPGKLHAWIAHARVTHAHVTPQLGRILCMGRGGRGPLEALRVICSGGDALRTAQANELREAAPGSQIVNFYGSTETPQAMAYHVFDPRTDADTAVVAIGQGIADVQLVVVDDGLAVAAAGVRGQIAIRTRYLSTGYRGDADLTRAKFVANPHTGDPGDQLYLTGDLGRFRADGVVEVDGRIDDQVKIRGFRVELGDVAAQLEQVAQVAQAEVLAERLPDGENRLVAYLVGDAAATATVREAMTAAMPAYMVPARLVWLPRIPLLPNNKVDRAALRALDVPEAGAAEVGPAGSLDAIEAAIVTHWQTLLAWPRVDLDASFVELGGDSLSFIQASVRLEALLGALPDRWERMSIRELARHARARRSPWTRIDASVLLRAVSIVAVVVGHLGLPDLTGSVRVLFVVSGMSFGRYLVPQILKTETAASILRLLAKIAIPAILYALVLNTMYRLPKWPCALLANNLVDPDSDVSGIGFWFIDVLAQCFVVLAAAVSIPAVRRAIARRPFEIALGASVVLAGIMPASPLVWDTSQLYDRVPHHYLGTLLLGWAASQAETPRRKLVVVVVGILTFAYPAYTSESPMIYPFVATAFVVFVPRVVLPKRFGRLVMLIATASLFIYLIDHQVEKALSRVGFGEHPLAILLVTIPAGIAFWKLWDRSSHVRFDRAFRARRAQMRNAR